MQNAAEGNADSDYAVGYDSQHCQQYAGHSQEGRIRSGMKVLAHSLHSLVLSVTKQTCQYHL